MVSVESEAITKIDYAATDHTLFIRFVDGGWYSCFDIPARVYESFLAAPCHGRFFHDHILDRYRFRRGR